MKTKLRTHLSHSQHDFKWLWDFKWFILNDMSSLVFFLGFFLVHSPMFFFDSWLCIKFLEENFWKKKKVFFIKEEKIHASFYCIVFIVFVSYYENFGINTYNITFSNFLYFFFLFSSNQENLKKASKKSSKNITLFSFDELK